MKIMNNKVHILEYLDKSRKVLVDCVTDADMISSIEKAGDIMRQSLRDGGKIIAIGNGGSACDASHFVSELVGKYKDVRSPWPAVALGDMASLTCIGNDFGFDHIFSRPINAIGNYGDVLLAISTSGKSINVCNAMEVARNNKSLRVIGLTGANPGKDFTDSCSVVIKVPSRDVGRIQEMHTKIIHVLVELLEMTL